jgi:hypothetical protein
MKNFISRSTTLLGLRICLLGLNDGFAVSWTHGGSREGSSCECREDGFVSCVCFLFDVYASESVNGRDAIQLLSAGLVHELKK